MATPTTGAIDLFRGLDAADIDGMVRNAARVKREGFAFVLTYLKWTKPAHVKALHDAGLAIGLIFERDTKTTLSGSGKADGDLARRQRVALGAPDSVPIFAAVDIGIGVATDLDRDGRPDVGEVRDYFAAFNTDAGYVDGDVAQALSLKHTWLAGAMGWPGSREYYGNGAWDVVQGTPMRGGRQLGVDWPDVGLEYDPDLARNLDWAWMPNAVAAPAIEPSPPGIVGIPPAIEAQRALKVAGLYTGKLDGQWGPQSQRALAAYYSR